MDSNSSITDIVSETYNEQGRIVLLPFSGTIADRAVFSCKYIRFTMLNSLAVNVL